MLGSNTSAMEQATHPGPHSRELAAFRVDYLHLDSVFETSGLVRGHSDRLVNCRQNQVAAVHVCV